MITFALMGLALGVVLGIGAFGLAPYFVTNEWLGRQYGWLAMKSVKRGAWILRGDGELRWKKLSYDSAVNSETVSIGGDTIILSDPARRLSSCFGKTLAIADETHGLIFSPVDAAAGNVKHWLEAQNAFRIPASKTERKDHNVSSWVRGWLGIPKSAAVDLRNAWFLAPGTGRGDDGAHVTEYYKNIKRDGVDPMAIVKIAMVPGAFILTLVLWSLVISGGGSGAVSGGAGGGTGGGNSTGNGTTLEILALLAIPALGPRVKAVGLFVLAGLGIIASLVLIPPLGAALIGFGVGFAISIALIIAAISVLGKLNFGGLTSGMLWDSAFGCLENPAIIETGSGYDLRDVQIDGPAHRWEKYRVQFGYDDSAIQSKEYYDGSEADREESSAERENLPERSRGNVGDYRLQWNESDELVATAGVVTALRDGFLIRETVERLQDAKKKYGNANFGPSDKLIAVLTFMSVLIAAGIGVAFL